MSLSYEKDNIPLARTLRKNATPEEKRLWFDFLSAYPVRFQRQKPIGRYIVDFYCHKAHMAIELDGSQHYTEQGLQNDQQRTAQLEQAGIWVVRFTNLDIQRNFRGVCAEIDRIVQNRLREFGEW